ncbi:YVTN repeat-like/Quino protein amine dehydrogenase [Thelephora ganbajun]|uniref:YVTN repeat-like/Quino protein amine dehydrogenase n=1 Tax=Thelephora ganbajun TaxID=370292 RepID=A0ACB6Z8R1_THEGA|nr:YVTN repeat-like/Quino protein amine dehydrogenase [Thelephora ganbajun]
MARIVHGLPDSWDPAIVTMQYSCMTAAWSPCGRLRTGILDAATLKRLTTLEFPEGHTHELVFSPDARLLMSFNVNPARFISWDLQTGVLQWDKDTVCFSITYSACGTMLGAFAVRTYNVHSGTHIYSHPVEGKVVGDIRTHDGCLRFATIKSGSIMTWEVGFTSRNAPTEIESLPLPDNFLHNSHARTFHPTLSRLAFTHSERIFAWDTRHSKFLLSEDAKHPCGISFSSDGRFFIYGTIPSAIHLWKESPTGYILHQKLNCETGISGLLISPNRGSIFVFGTMAIQLSRTMDSTTSSPRKQIRRGFTVEFSLDETLAAVAGLRGKTITILNLKSSDPLSTIDTGMVVHGQRAAGDTVVAFNDEKVVTWNLPTRGRVPNTKAIQTATIGCPGMGLLRSVSISPDLHSIAIAVDTSLHLHDVPTGRCLVSVPIHGKGFRRPWFTSDGRQVWCIVDEGEANGFTIFRDSKSGVVKLEHLEPTNQPPSTPPWLPSRGYQILDDGWILGSSGKRLLRLPPLWRSSDTARRTWSGRFLALSHRELPEAVILELEE